MWSVLFVYPFECRFEIDSFVSWQQLIAICIDSLTHSLRIFLAVRAYAPDSDILFNLCKQVLNWREMLQKECSCK